MNTDPIQLFKEWYQYHLQHTSSRLPATCCLSTNGLDGYPDARHVALKEATENGFIITGPVSSRKGIEIAMSNKVALTFWWAEAERQVRIQGDAIPIGNDQADKYFAERNRDSRIVSAVSKQGEELVNAQALAEQYDQLAQSHHEIKRPVSWGGYLIQPVRIEFLEFKPTRFHDRTLYEMYDGKWTMRKLQP